VPNVFTAYPTSKRYTFWLSSESFLLHTIYLLGSALLFPAITPSRFFVAR
jgi:hypothetical protein